MSDDLSTYKPDDMSSEDLASIQKNLEAFQHMLNKLDIWEAAVFCSLTLRSLLDTLVSRLGPDDHSRMSMQLRAAYEYFIKYDQLLRSKDTKQ